jgi:ATP-dependent Clp protease adapter protein ClpS
MDTTQVLAENGIAYMPARIAELAASGYAIDFTDPYTVFVNGNFPTVTASIDEVFEKLFEFDNVDTTGMPVVVYKLGEKFVAWYDQEAAQGFVQKDSCELGF